MPKRVAVVGAGCCGLVAIKCCLDEGLVPVCFESHYEIGGLWHYSDEVKDGRGSVMKSTVINCSKEMLSYSNYTVPAKVPNFMHHTKVWEYLSQYAKRFELHKHIRFNTEVLSIRQEDGFDVNGRWVIETRNGKANGLTKEVFDAVMLCSGHHAEKNMPNFEGMEEFQGRIVHPRDYKTPQAVVDKRVVVVGLGNSAADIIVEAGRTGKQAFLSTRRGGWIQRRVTPSGTPLDVSVNTRLLWTIFSYLPSSFHLWFMERKAMQGFNHELYGLKPKHRYNAANPMVCDELANRIACGGVIVKPDIKRLTKNGVEFTDGTFEDNIDLLVCATGYQFSFKMVKHPDLETRGNRVDLYKFVFPPNFKRGTLAVIGCVQPLGALIPIAELQCRWATRVFKGEAILPASSVMWDEVKAREADMRSRYVDSARHTIQVDGMPYMDDLAREIGCKPNLKRLLFKDPRLAWECFVGPCTPYQYRLEGPGSWEGASEAILNQWDRTFKSVRTMPCTVKGEKRKIYVQGFLSVLLVLFLGVFFVNANF